MSMDQRKFILDLVTSLCGLHIEAVSYMGGFRDHCRKSGVI